MFSADKTAIWAGKRRNSGGGPQRKAGRFYPTRLALNIASRGGEALPAAPAQGQAQAGYVVVETNYRVYAYTQTNLQVALLGLFCELMYRSVHLEFLARCSFHFCLQPKVSILFAVILSNR